MDDSLIPQSQTPQPRSRQKILFICGSLNQTTQMHQVACELPEFDHVYTPFYAEGALELLRLLRGLEFTVIGYKLRERCMAYLRRLALPIDVGGKSGDYDLVITCSDVMVQRNIRRKPIVVVQEGILDPPSVWLKVWRLLPVLPRWIAGTATTGLSGLYDRFCVASEGYRDLFIKNGAPADRVVVTGIPNFDNCRRFEANSFPYRGFVLVCSSDARETLKGDDRTVFLQRCRDIAAGRQLIFKLHPNENAVRAIPEIEAACPGALVYSEGCAEEMIANCDVLITQYSSTVFVGLALGKEVHSYFDVAELKRLMPVQNCCAARNIAVVCREVLQAGATAKGRDAGKPALLPALFRPRMQ